MKFGLFPLRPAYGRDYQNRTEVEKDFYSNKDFETSLGQWTNREDLKKYAEVKEATIRYNRSRCIISLPIHTDDGK